MSASLPTSGRVPTSDPSLDELLLNQQLPLAFINLKLEEGEVNVDMWREKIYGCLQHLLEIFLPLLETWEKNVMEGNQQLVPITEDQIKLLKIAKDQVQPNLKESLENLEKDLICYYKVVYPSETGTNKIITPRASPLPTPDNPAICNPQESSVSEQPIDRLLRVVKSLSPEAYDASVEALLTAHYPPATYPPSLFGGTSYSSVAEVESTTTIKGIDPLLEEIRTINSRLVTTTVGLCDSNAKIVKCSFTDMSTMQDPIQPLMLYVPETYPQESPLVLDVAGGKMDELTKDARARLKEKLEEFDQPLSLEKIAKTWNSCANKVFLDYAVKLGGGSFSSTYGGWEKVTD